MQHAIAHRRDIDGLRAIAVLSVIFYHYDVPGFGGGFVGVDIFFVISGFLIAGQIAKEIAADKFSLLTFYERRVRRIFPALFFMYALVLLAAALILFPPDLTGFSATAVYVIPFLANFEFYRVAGLYGAPYAQHIVLLHTWTLAVEEQFYLLFPLLMLAITRFGQRRYRLILGLLGLSSFLMCVVAVRIEPEAAFYLAPFRAWELLLGALLALKNLREPTRTWQRGGLALSGLALIAVSDVLLSNDASAPGECALLPCVGASLILYAACDRSLMIGRVLDNPLAVRVGNWSYSLYLFHWPMLVLARYYAFVPLSLLARAVLLGMTFAVAVLSWRFVEQPFRGRGLLSRGTLCAVAATTATCLIVSAIALREFYAIPRLHAPNEPWSLAFLSEAQKECADLAPAESAEKPGCRLGSTEVPVDALLWGDSHALALLPAVNAAFSKHGDAAALAELGGCPPLIGVRVDWHPADVLGNVLAAIGVRRHDLCEPHNDAVLRWVSRHKIATVILAGHWIVYADARQGVTFLTDARPPNEGPPAGNAEVFRRGLDRLFAELERLHARTFVLDDAPQIGVDVPYALASVSRLNSHADIRITQAAYAAQQRIVTRILADHQKRYGFQILRLQDLLCANDPCAVSRNGRSLYNDDEHLSPFGAMTVQPIFGPIWTGRR